MLATVLPSLSPKMALQETIRCEAGVMQVARQARDAEKTRTHDATRLCSPRLRHVARRRQNIGRLRSVVVDRSIYGRYQTMGFPPSQIIRAKYMIGTQDCARSSTRWSRPKASRVSAI